MPAVFIVIWAFSMSATQFRVFNIGLSEISFVLLLLLTFIYKKRSFEISEPIVIFVTFFAFILCSGWLTNAIVEKNFSASNRDAIALAYALFGSLFLISMKRFKIDYVLLGSFLSIQFIFIAFCLSVLAPWVPIPIDFWYGGNEEIINLADVGRFKGWSENPNQLGLFLIVAFYYNFHNSNKGYKVKLIYSIPLIVVMILVNSSATILSVFILMIIPWLISISFKWRSSAVMWGLKLSIYLFSFIIFILSALLFFNKTGEFDGNGRLPLWRNSILALFESPFWGWGPGGHAGYTAPFEGWESHNIFIDILTQSGILGLLSFLILIGFLLNRLWRSGRYKQISLVLSFLVYGFSHYMLRIPLFWVVLFSFYVGSCYSINKINFRYQSKSVN